ncbi:hypothetical protein GUJ93_ZPchr0077g7061 [Zizania palustris]|uniref:Pentatricopeptide repeat-containing protein n=1 Tax=Zizania palustris TaxID=103762 RepID=A0A8J5QW77_ZIZPA|nr:hypothetical protein GUJ93_ZPchr0077g7061 [Zizania palustris]
MDKAYDIFHEMKKQGISPDGIIRTLLRKAEVAKAGNYLSKIDENNFVVEASTASLLLSLFSMEGDFLHSFVSRRLLHNVDVGFPLNSQPEVSPEHRTKTSTNPKANPMVTDI